MSTPRRICRLRTALALAPILLLLAAPIAAATRATPPATPAAPPRERPPIGAYCTPAGCRETASSPWTAAAFGLAVVVIHRSARSRPIR